MTSIGFPGRIKRYMAHIAAVLHILEEEVSHISEHPMAEENLSRSLVLEEQLTKEQMTASQGQTYACTGTLVVLSITPGRSRQSGPAESAEAKQHHITALNLLILLKYGRI